MTALHGGHIWLDLILGISFNIGRDSHINIDGTASAHERLRNLLALLESEIISGQYFFQGVYEPWNVLAGGEDRFGLVAVVVVGGALDHVFSVGMVTVGAYSHARSIGMQESSRFDR